jgi:hypothetical protein
MGSKVDVARAQWPEVTADRLEQDLRGLVKDLMRDAVKLGRLTKGSREYRELRDSIARNWARFELAQLRSQVTREARRATRSELHHRLCEIARAADADLNANQRSHLAWKRAIDGVISWLDAWSK